MQGRRPGVKHGAAVGMIDVVKELDVRIDAHPDVVVVLNPEDHAPIAGRRGTLAKGADAEVPVALKAVGLGEIAGEDADDPGIEPARHLGEPPDVTDLELDGRELGVAAEGEVGIGGDRGDLDSGRRRGVADRGELAVVGLERRQVRTFPHQLDGRVSEPPGPGQKRLQIEPALTPEARIADREQGRNHRRLPAGRWIPSPILTALRGSGRRPSGGVFVEIRGGCGRVSESGILLWPQKFG